MPSSPRRSRSRTLQLTSPRHAFDALAIDRGISSETIADLLDTQNGDHDTVINALGIADRAVAGNDFAPHREVKRPTTSIARRAAGRRPTHPLRRLTRWPQTCPTWLPSRTAAESPCCSRPSSARAEPDAAVAGTHRRRGKHRRTPVTDPEPALPPREAQAPEQILGQPGRSIHWSPHRSLRACDARAIQWLTERP